MKQLFECGEEVLFSTGENRRKSNIGMILKYKEDTDEYAVLSVYNSSYKNIRTVWIEPISNVGKIRDSITKYWEGQIKEQEKLIRKPTQEEKSAEKIKKYDELKNQIKTVARRLADTTDDTDFENRLKAIADMKKNIFSIELGCSSDIRKENGRIKWKIRELISNKDNELRKISDENIEKEFTF